MEAKYGKRPDVTCYRTWQVLEEMAMASDEHRLGDLVNREYQRIMRPRK